MSDAQWVDKHAPSSLSEIQGHNKHIKQMKKWASNWTRGDDAQLLVGPPGIGKTTIAKALSNDYEWPIEEVNASDSRQSQGIEDLAQEIEVQPTISEWKLIMVDEVDSLHHTTDKTPLYEALDDPGNPVILVGNDKYTIPKALKRRCTVRDMNLGKRSRRSYLKSVADEEGVDYSDDEIDMLAERPGLRSAIHDLQVWASSEDTLPPSADGREWSEDEFSTVEAMIRGQTDMGETSPPDMAIWLDENLPKHYRGLEVMVAFDSLSRADEWLGRANTTQKFKYWRYAATLIEHIPSVKLTETWDGYLNLDFPNWFRQKTDSHDGKSPEAALFRALKDYDEGTYQFSGSYSEFKQTMLPLIKQMPKRNRLELCLAHGLDSKERNALDITDAEFTGWTEGEVPDRRQESSETLMHSDPLSF